ncbi:MAG: hypothetical protein J6W51_09360 [Fibrobacter sp.]|nr:hypothetical protein [Fibrobacter sp.]
MLNARRFHSLSSVLLFASDKQTYSTFDVIPAYEPETCVKSGNLDGGSSLP